MATKNNPNGFRLGVTRPYSTKWFEKNKVQYAERIYQDAEIRQIVAQVYPDLVEIVIERRKVSTLLATKISKSLKRRLLKNPLLMIYVRVKADAEQNLSPYSRTLLTFKGSASFKKQRKVSDVKKFLSTKIGLTNFDLAVEEIKTTTAQTIGIELQNTIIKARRLSFKPILKSALQNLTDFKGVQIELAGRTPSSAMATTERITSGVLPKQTLAAKIDYCAFGVPTKLGVIGVKIWLYA